MKEPSLLTCQQNTGWQHRRLEALKVQLVFRTWQVYLTCHKGSATQRQPLFDTPAITF